MTDITIPPAALEAGAMAICDANCWPHSKAMFCDEVARATFLAMIEAWKGAAVCYYTIGDDEGYEMVLPLPFPQEASDE